jgi:hypothetical protein
VKLIEEEDSGYIAEMMDELGIPMNSQAEPTQTQPEVRVEPVRQTRSTREATSSSTSSSQGASKKAKIM